jgi:hypothetical protein
MVLWHHEGTTMRVNVNKSLIIVMIPIGLAAFFLTCCVSPQSQNVSQSIYPDYHQAAEQQTPDKQDFSNLITNDTYVYDQKFKGIVVSNYINDQNLFQSIQLEREGFSFSARDVVGLLSYPSNSSHSINPKVIISLMKLKESRDGPNVERGTVLK